MIEFSFQSMPDTDRYPFDLSKLYLQNNYAHEVTYIKLLATLIHPYADEINNTYEVTGLLPHEKREVNIYGEYDFLRLNIYALHGGSQEIFDLSFDTYESQRNYQTGSYKKIIFPKIIQVHDPIPDFLQIIQKRKSIVLLLGKDTGEELKRLRYIQKLLTRFGYKGILLKDYEDIASESNEEKVMRFIALANFVILENSIPSGHIDELKILSFFRKVTCVLNFKGVPATWMQADYEQDFNFIKFFNYDELNLDTMNEIIAWGNQKIEERTEYFNAKYSWRNRS